MTTKVYRPPPVAPNAHLEQLVALKEAEESSLSEFQKMLRRSLLSERALKAMRKMHIREMVIAGYRPEQIKLAFVAPDSSLNTLVDGLKTVTGARTFRGEIVEAFEQCANLDADAYREIYIESRQRLLNACWDFLGRIEPPQAKALIELMDKLQQDIAEAHGAIHQRAGKRPSTHRPGPPSGGMKRPPAQLDEAVKEGDPESVNLNWEEGFEADDSEDSTPTTE